MQKIEELTQPESDISSAKSLQDRPFMYISYVDDSGSGTSEADDKNCPFLVMGGPIIEEGKYLAMESALSSALKDLVPEEEWDDFEFHASNMFHGKPPFDRLGAEKCRDILQQVLEWMAMLKMPILYGSVNKPSLRIQVYSSADPVDMAFRLYLEALDDWFMMRVFQKEHAKGILIVDDFEQGNARKRISRAFRQWRSKPLTRAVKTGLAHHLLDDIYFGDSKNSIGIQLADVCVYFIARHLAEKPDSEGFYNIIKDQIYRPKIFD